MDLLEYQAKEIFEKVGIPVLPSQPISDPSGLKRLNIPYPVVLKSQVHTGGRGKAGGIRFVANTIDAIAAAHSIFNLPIAGEYPEVILVESRYNAQREIFLAILLDYQLQRPVLLGASQGGMDVGSLLETLQKVVVDEEFSPYLARRLAIKMELEGALIESVSAIIEKMYELFVSQDLDIIEINPLGVNSDGEMMALDGKISINDHALKRHPDLLALTPPSSLLLWSILDKTGQIAIISNCSGLMLSTWDRLVESGGKLAGWLILEERLELEELSEQLKAGLEHFQLLPNLKVIIVNIVSYSPLVQRVIEGIADYEDYEEGYPKSPRIGNREDRVTRATRQKRQVKEPSVTVNPTRPQIILRVAGNSEESSEPGKRLPLVNIHWLESLEQAVSQAIAIANG